MACAQLRRQRRARRLLDELLVAALDRAVPLVEVHGVAVAVGQNLHLDVARTQKVLLDVDGVVAEGRAGLGLRGHEVDLEFLDVARDAHPLAAAARRRLDQDREADLLGEGECLVVGLDDSVAARHRRHAGGGHGLARDRLVAHPLDGVRRRADEDDARILACAREVGVLGEEAVARVDRLRAGLKRRRDDVGHVEVRQRRRTPVRCRRRGPPSRRAASPCRPRSRRRPTRRPSPWQALMTRSATSPRLATRIRSNTDTSG